MIQELVNEMFSTGQLKNVFADFKICKHYSDSKQNMNEDRYIRRMKYNINSIIHSLIQFDRYEKGGIKMFVDEFNEEGYEIMAHHESLLHRFKSIVRYSYWLFEECTKTEVKDYKEILHLLCLTNDISDDEKSFLSLDWYGNIDDALKCIMNEGKLKAYAENDIIKFQVYDNEKKSISDFTSEPVIINESNMLTECPIVWVHSKIYFSTCLLYLLKYLETLSKYLCIQLFSKVYYDIYKGKSKIDNMYNSIEIKPEENTLGIIRVLSEIPNVTLNCLNFGKMVI